MTPSKNLFASAPLVHKAARQISCGLAAITAAFFGLLAGAGTSHAASAAFTANPADTNWANGANWSTGAVPGLVPTTSATTNDVATFNTPLAVNPVTGTGTIGGADNPILPDANRNIGSILFDTANVGAYVIGTSAGNALFLDNIASGANAVTITAPVTSSQIFAGPVQFRSPSSQSNPYSFINNATSNATTLSFTGAVNLLNTTRGYTFTLSGSNTGANIISGNITYTVTTAGGFIPFIKTGTGTWILAGTNTFTSNANGLFYNTTNPMQVNGGTLVLQNSQALGTNATANLIKFAINNGGTLQLANNAATGSITLDNGVGLLLNSGGTLSANGTETVNSGITVGATAATAVTIGTTNAADVFTIGNALNDLTGGAADSVINVAGPGTVLLGQASNYLGGFSINGGTLTLGNATALGTTAKAISFGAGSAGALQLNGNSLTVSALNTNATTPGTPTVTNGLAGAATLTINNATANTYAGTLQNGAAGTLALVKTGAGALTLSGASTYTGGTTISAGTLFANNATGSATGSGAVAINSATLAGNGAISGAVTVGSGSRVSPGVSGTGSVGNLTVGQLTLGTGSNLDFDITNTTTLDQITVTGAGGLTINGGQLNINGAAATFTTNGVYNLIAYNGAVGGTGVSALTLNGTNQDQANNTYTFGLSGSYVTLTVASSAVPVDYYTPNANSAYSNGANWSAGTPPNAVGAFAGLGGNGSAALTANRTITVDGAYTVGTVAFNSTTGFGYTLADGGVGTGLTLNNGGSTSFVSDTAGTHAITAAVAMTDNGATFGVTSAADTLAVSGVVSSSATTNLGLTKTGNGTLALTGANTYFGGTALNGGTIQINSPSSLGDTSGNLVFGGGALQLLADVTTTRNYQVSGGSNAVVDTNGHALVQNGTLTPSAGGTGGLVKNGLGTLTLAGTNTYTGATTINGGVVSVGADANLGVAPTAAANNIVINNGTLQATAGFVLNANRSITLNNATSTIDTGAGSFLTYTGTMSGAGALNLTGTGTLSLSTVQNYTGNTFLSGANLQFNPGAGLVGNITLSNGGTLTLRSAGNTSVFPGNNIIVAAGSSGTLNSNVAGNAPGSVFSSGDAASVLNITGTPSLGANNVKQFGAGYTGTVRLGVGSQLRFSGTITAAGGGNGGDTTTFDLGATSLLYTKNGGGISLGALTGTGTLGGASTAGAVVTYLVGAKNLSTTFAGNLNGSAGLTATGTGTLTLTGDSSAGTGTVTANTGATLQVGDGTTTGILPTGPVVANGTVAFNRSDSYTVANAFTGTGTLTFLGTGTKTLTGSTALTALNASFGTLIVDPVIGSGLAVNALASTLAPNAGDNATVTVQNSGSYNVNSANLIVGGQGMATLNVNGATAAGNGATGGMVVLQGGLTIGNSAAAVGTVNLNAGGTLNTPTIITGGGSSTLNLNGGNLVVAAGSSGTFITGLTAVNVQAGGAIINDSGSTVTIAQVLQHDPALGAALDGGFTKPAGSTGILTLAAANTYNGGTTINAGTLAVSVNGGLATGNVTLAAGATLSLGTGVTFAHNNNQTTALTLVDTTGVINLAAGTGTVQDVVGSLTIGGTSYPAGFYGSSTSGALPGFQLPEFTGNGLLDVGIPLAIPEPSTYAMFAVGLGGLGLLMARRKRTA